MNANRYLRNIADLKIEQIELPEYVFTRRFKNYFLFDNDVCSSDQLATAIQRAVKKRFTEMKPVYVFASSDLLYLGSLDINEQWSAGIARLIAQLRSTGDFYGITIADEQRQWVAYQSSPVDIGVLAIDGTNCSKDFEVDKDYFFDSKDIRQWLSLETEHDRALVQLYGADYFYALLKNYSSQSP